MFKASKPFALLLSSSSWNLVNTKAPASGPETANSADQDEDLTAQPGKENSNNAFDALQYLWNLVAGAAKVAKGWKRWGDDVRKQVIPPIISLRSHLA
jgi:hypothetical protein